MADTYHRKAPRSRLYHLLRALGAPARATPGRIDRWDRPDHQHLETKEKGSVMDRPGDRGREGRMGKNGKSMKDLADDRLY